MKHEKNKLGNHIISNKYSQWEDPETIKNSYTVKRINIEDDNNSGGGIPIISDGKIVYVDYSDSHSFISGSTGSKKTRLFGMPLINLLALSGESFIATDPKGELYEKTSGLVSAKGYKTIVLNFRNLNQSDNWNILEEPYKLYHNGKTEEAISLLNDIITALAEPQRSSAKDLYWIEMACAQALANMLFFIDTASPEEANIYNFILFFVTTCSVEYTQKLASYVADGSIASLNYKSILTNGPTDKTFGNVSSCVSNMINPFIVRKSLCQVLSQSSFDIRSIGKTKTAIYIIVPDEKTTLHFLVTLFIKQIYEAVIDEAQQQKNQKLPIRLNFVLDEFCNIPAIPDMPSMISAARSRNIRFFLMVQSMWQLKQKYHDDAQTIKGNCDNWIFLTSREYDLLKEISNLCGDTFYKDSDDTIKTRPLISISELQRFNKQKGEALILHGRNYPFVTELPDIDEYKFKFYPSIKAGERKLPQIVRYNIEKVIDDIAKKTRPLPFSMEVFGHETFYEKSKEKLNFLDW